MIPEFCMLVDHSTQVLTRYTGNSARSEMFIESEAPGYPRTPEEWHVDYVESAQASR